MSGIPPPPPPPSYSSISSPKNRNCSGSANKGGGLLGFLGEAKSRLVRAFINPPNFLHSPLNNARKGGANNLNFPFQPMSPSSTSPPPSDEDDLEAPRDLDSQVTQMEVAVKVILTDVEEAKPKTPQDNTPKSDPEEGLDGIFSPPNSVLSSRDRIPLSIYAELIALYDQDLYGMGGRSGISCSTNTPRDEDAAPLSGDQYCRNQGKNLRKEVLKWNKDN